MGQSELAKTDVNVSADRQKYPVQNVLRLVLMAYFCPHNVRLGLPSENSFVPKSYFLSTEAECPYRHGNDIAK